MNIKNRLLSAFAQADSAEGHALSLEDKRCEPIKSLSIHPEATDFQPAIEFDNGTYIPAEILNSASISGNEITIPGKATFRLLKKVPIDP